MPRLVDLGKRAVCEMAGRLLGSNEATPPGGAAIGSSDGGTTSSCPANTKVPVGTATAAASTMGGHEVKPVAVDYWGPCADSAGAPHTTRAAR
jgi:hypothetical protein